MSGCQQVLVLRSQVFNVVVPNGVVSGFVGAGEGSPLAIVQYAVCPQSMTTIIWASAIRHATAKPA